MVCCFKAIGALAFAPDGTLLVGISADGTLRVWAFVEENNEHKAY